MKNLCIFAMLLVSIVSAKGQNDTTKVDFEIYTASDIIFVYPCSDKWEVKSEILGFLIECNTLSEAFKIVEKVSPIDVPANIPIREYEAYLRESYKAILQIQLYKLVFIN